MNLNETNSKQWYVGAMNDACFIIDTRPHPVPVDYLTAGDPNTNVIAGPLKQADADALVKSHNALLPHDCCVCGRPKSFVIDPNNTGSGFCFAENTLHVIKPGPNGVCQICHQIVPVRHCDVCNLDYCNEGEDDDRWCAIEHQNRHEDKGIIS